MERKNSNKEVEIKEEGSSWATYVEEFMKQSSRVSVCILSKSGDVWAHRGNFPSYCFAPLCGGPFKKGVTVKLSASAYYVEDVKVDIRGVTRVRFDRDSLVAFYTNICIIALCIEASESPNDDYANVGDPVTTNCESLANALAIYLQESDPPLIARVATPGFRPVTPGANMQAGREGWDALAASTITHKGDVTEYILCSTDCRSIYSSAGDVKFLSHEGPVTQEDGTEKVEVIDEAANMATALGTRVKPRQGIRINTSKYQLVQTYVDDQVSQCYTIIGRRKRAGFVGVTTESTIIICLFSEDDGQTVTTALNRASKLAGYLKEMKS